MDVVSPEKRSQIMSAVKSKDTKAEILVRHYLWSQGFRYRIHRKDLPGKPDISIAKYKLAIFIHGCFWHGHEGCSRGRLPKTKLEYWEPKIRDNRNRDLRVQAELMRSGWASIIVWDCQLRTKTSISSTLESITKSIESRISEANIYSHNSASTNLGK